MNTPVPLRTYHVKARKPQKICVDFDIKARDRREAVTKALNWFWYEYLGAMGSAHEVLTVDDPYMEVRYGPKFICNDRKNKLLPPDVIERILKESNGELERDLRAGRPHFPPGSVKRIKRRRDFGRFIAPCLKRMNNGVLYYRIGTRSQISRGGRRIRKPKYRDIRLQARNLPDAIEEIRQRKLNQLTEKRRNMKVRELDALAHIAGVIELSNYQRKKYKRVLFRYEQSRVRVAIPA